MRKMILLAAMVAIAALMLAAAPAMADDNDGDGHDDVTFRLVGGDFCDFFGFFGCINHDDDDFCDFVDCRDDDDFCDFVDCRDDDFNRFDFNDGFGDFEQDAESGDIDQSFDVSGTGDNSNQTVGIQGVANTGNAQNQIGVVDADGFGDFDDNDFNRNDFCDDFNNRNDFCDDFNNGDDFCEDFRGANFCEDLEDFCEDFNGDNICDFFFDHDDRFFFHDDDRVFFGDDNDGDIEFEDVGSTIELSPTNTVSSDQQVNQAASAFGS